MAAPSAAAAALGARTAHTPLRQQAQPGRRRRQQQQQRGIRSSLEDEFKKQCLGRTNGTSSSSNAEWLKDLAAARDLAAAAANGAGLQPPAAEPSPAAGPAAGPLDEGAGPYAQPPLGNEPYHPLEYYPGPHADVDWDATTPAGDAAWAGAAAHSRCFVILFGVGRAETEGIYSLRAVAKHDGLPTDTIVAFEAEDDAIRYSTLLEATMDHEPTVWPIEWGELLEFCDGAGYRCRLELAGSLLIPPDYNVGMTDWEKSLRLRQGRFSVLGAEPATRPGDALFLDGPAWVFESALEAAQDDVEAEQVSAVIDSQLSSPAAVEAMKASLERLLPRD